MDCDQIYLDVMNGESIDNYILFKLAQCFISGYDKHKLRNMLLSEDLNVVIDGLFVAGEVGSLGKEFIDEYIKLSENSDDAIRNDARRLLRTWT